MGKGAGVKVAGNSLAGRIQLRGIQCSEKEGIMHRVRCLKSRKDGQELWAEVRRRVLSLDQGSQRDMNAQ